MSAAGTNPGPERWRAAMALSAAIVGYIEQYRSDHPEATLADVRDALKDVYTQYLGEALWGKAAVTSASLCDSYAAFARSQAFIVGGRTMRYFDAMVALEKIAALDPDPIRRLRAGVLAATLADAVMFDFLAVCGRPEPADGGLEMPVGHEAERYVIASSGLGVLFADESLLSVAQGALGFSGSVGSRDLLASVLAPPLVSSGGQYELGSSLPLLDDILAHDDPAARLRQHAAMRSWHDVHPHPLRGRGQPLVSLDGLDIEIEAPVTERALMLAAEDLAWVDAQLRATGNRQHAKTAAALAAYRETGGSRAAMGDSLYLHLWREARKPSYLGWLIRQRI